MGFGTGLNAFLTAIEAIRFKKKIQYTAIEQFPLTIEEAALLNYSHIIGHTNLFRGIHDCKWNAFTALNEYFTLRKIQANFITFSTRQQFNLIYYDTFAPNVQPELWTKDILKKLLHMLKPQGLLVTYCSKGDVRRSMITAGFNVKIAWATRQKRNPQSNKILRKAPAHIPVLFIL